jgi:hypothetical protein
MPGGLCGRRRAARSAKRERLVVAGAGPGSSSVQLRVRPLRGRPPPRHRHRRAGRRGGRRAGQWDGLVLRNSAPRWANAHDPDGRRVLGHAAPPGLARCAARSGGRGGPDGRDRRAERRRRVASPVRVLRSAPHGRSAGLPRSTALPAAPRDGPACRASGFAFTSASASARACAFAGAGGAAYVRCATDRVAAGVPGAAGRGSERCTSSGCRAWAEPSASRLVALEAAASGR